MAKNNVKLNKDVTDFLDKLNHPFRKEIEKLRILILTANSGLSENIKWNGPNYCFDNNDRITMRIQPPKQIQLILHRGAKVKAQPKNKLIENDVPFLIWKENDRAVATFKNEEEIEKGKRDLTNIVNSWIKATM